MSYLIQKGQRVAFVMSARLGDTLIAMVIVRNLVAHGVRVTVFSQHLSVLKDWFPRFDLQPALQPQTVRSSLDGYDTVVHTYAADVVGDVRSWHPRAWVMDEWAVYRQIKPMLDIQLDVCRTMFGLTELSRSNGIHIPATVDTRVARRRAVIHPTASALHKQWLPQRFLRLARQLEAQGYEPCFVVAPGERMGWMWVESSGYELVSHASLADLAGWLASAGVFVGNDSGIAHLASNIGVPVVSLAMRPRIARRWAPGWSPSVTLTPIPLMPGRMLREAFWKHLLPVSRVVNAVEGLRRRVSGTPRAYGPVPLLGHVYPGLLGRQWANLLAMRSRMMAGPAGLPTQSRVPGTPAVGTPPPNLGR
jgi:heptosyltransferase-3